MTRRGLSLPAALLAISLAAACTSETRPSATPAATETAAPSPTATVAPSPTPEPVPPPEPIVWQPCEDSGLECASLSAPLDYTHASGQQIELALIRQPARDPANRIGVLVLNYGGPGNTGIDRLKQRAASYPAAIQDRFDLVSFDPRGVKYSEPALICRDDSPAALPAAVPWPVSEQDWRDVVAVAQGGFAVNCAQSGGDLLPYLGTANVARDLDRLRQALGEEQISYLGESYGTVIGQVYADMYPDSVRSMVLDGVSDPNLSGQDWGLDQALGFEGTLQRFFDYCRSIACIADGSDPAEALDRLIEGAKTGAIVSSGGRDVSPLEVYQAMLQAMYTSGAWPNFARFINEGLSGQGDQIAGLAQAYAQPQANGTYDNWADVNAAVTCIDRDFPQGAEAFRTLATDMAEAAPHFGAPIAQGYGACSFWPVPSQPVEVGAASAAPPILLVAATGDPFTPYKEAVSVSRRIDTAVLLTYDGESHPSYQRGVPCIDEAVNAYLLSGTMPAEGTVCGSAGITPVPSPDP